MSDGDPGVFEARLWKRGSEDWPSGFADLGDREPEQLWRAGPLATGQRRIVAIVGSRKATVSGLVRARELGEHLSAMGICVISGLARGIDGAALAGAIQAGTPAIAVLGNGLPRIYPDENKSLAEQMVLKGGGIVTEHDRFAPPRAAHFPQRNRLISAWAEVVVVVEATRKSGSLGTAHRAFEMGRSVLAFPGSVDSSAYGGCHSLIRDGAHLVESVSEVSAWLTEHREPYELKRENRRLERLWQISGISASSELTRPGALAEMQQRTGWSAAYLLRVWRHWQSRQQEDESFKEDL